MYSQSNPSTSSEQPDLTDLMNGRRETSDGRCPKKVKLKSSDSWSQGYTYKANQCFFSPHPDIAAAELETDKSSRSGYWLPKNDVFNKCGEEWDCQECQWTANEVQCIDI